jgi:hypothetical protein
MHTKAYNVVFPDNAIFNVIKGGVAKDVADGFYIITEPLAKAIIHFILNQVYYVKMWVARHLALLRISNIT